VIKDNGIKARCLVHKDKNCEHAVND